ncbi:MAG TPA: tetratricopeptide repeat protein [Planctomycetota bacterium]|nr:tetratricopeptide repeat protein [Planctomycetota bacterium]
MTTIADLVREAYSHWNDARNLSRAGCELHDRNRLDLARDVLERSVELDPTDRDAWAHLAFAYMRGFQPRKGFDTFRTAIERTGSDLLRAVFAGFTPDKAEQARLLEEAAGNNHPSVRAAVASARYGGGDAAAFEEMRRLTDDPHARETWLWAVMNARWRGGGKDIDIRKEAVPLAEQVIAEQPDRVNGYWLKAHLLLAAQDWDGARKAAEEALARFPDEETMMFVRGRGFKETGDLDRAAQCFSRAIGAKPSFAGARTELGKVYEAQGRFDLAEEVFREIPRANPDYAGGAVSLALFLGRRGRWDEAETVFLEAWKRLQPWQQARLKQQRDVADLLSRPGVGPVAG